MLSDLADIAEPAFQRSGAARPSRSVRRFIGWCGSSVFSTSAVTEDTWAPLETLLPLDRLGAGREKQEIVFDRTYRINRIFLEDIGQSSEVRIGK